MIEGLDTPKSAFHWSKDEMNDVLARPTVHFIPSVPSTTKV
jgi:hypothetical protein